MGGVIGVVDERVKRVEIVKDVAGSVVTHRNAVDVINLVRVVETARLRRAVVCCYVQRPAETVLSEILAEGRGLNHAVVVYRTALHLGQLAEVVIFVALAEESVHQVGAKRYIAVATVTVFVAVENGWI